MPEQIQSGVSRRGVIKAAAWAAPVVSVAVAAPLAAATNQPQPPPPPAFTIFGGTMKARPGQVGQIELRGVAANGIDRGGINTEQSFLIRNSTLNFDDILIGQEDCTIEKVSDTEWRIKPSHSNVTRIMIYYRGDTEGNFEIYNETPLIAPGGPWPGGIEAVAGR